MMIFGIENKQDRNTFRSIGRAKAEKFRKIPKNSKKFRKIPKNSEKFRTSHDKNYTRRFMPLKDLQGDFLAISAVCLQKFVYITWSHDQFCLQKS